MSTINLKVLIDKFPEDRETIQKLLNIFAEESERAQQKEFSINRLFDRVSPRSVLALAQILNYLENDGALQKIIRVESPNYGGIADFSSLFDVPEVIHDWRRDVEMFVTPDDINIFYKVISDLDANVSQNGC